MEGKDKLKISHQELRAPYVDEAIADEKRCKGVRETQACANSSKPFRAFGKRRLQFIALVLSGIMLFLGVSRGFNYILSLRDRTIEIGTKQYVLSKKAQEYLHIFSTSHYEKTRSVLIIQEPHGSLSEQVNLLKGLEIFFQDNPSLISKTIFLSEGVPIHQPLSVEPLVEVSPDPDEGIIREVLGSFLIPGYVGYEWKHQQPIPIVGIEDELLYNLSANLWVELQDNLDAPDYLKSWEFTVACRNRSMAKALIEQVENYENPILFIGGLHLDRQLDADFQDVQNQAHSNPLTEAQATYLSACENFGVHDYLEAQQIGYTFIDAASDPGVSTEERYRDNLVYTELFRVQQTGDYDGYINWRIHNIEYGVTVAPSPSNAAGLVRALNTARSGTGRSSSNGRGFPPTTSNPSDPRQPPTRRPLPVPLFPVGDDNSETPPPETQPQPAPGGAGAMQGGGGSRRRGGWNPEQLQLWEPADPLAAERFRRGLPEAGSENDNSTVAMLTLSNGREFIGINSQSDQSSESREITLRVNGNVKGDAETHAFQQAHNALQGGEISKEINSATLKVDRSLCYQCGQQGQVKSMARQLGIRNLRVITPKGERTIDPFNPLHNLKGL